MFNPKRIAIALELGEDLEQHHGIYRGILRYAGERKDWHCFIDERPRRKGDYSGVIGRVWPQLRKRIQLLDLPWVNVLYHMHRPGIAGVYSDPKMRAELGAEHLIERGFKRFAGIYNPENTHSNAIGQAFKRRIMMEELTYLDLPIDFNYEVKHWDKLARNLEKMIRSLPFPAAFFIAEPINARLFVQLAQEMGLSVPHDVAVVCHKNFESTLGVPTSITAVKSDFESVGYEAARLLDRLMAGEPVPPDPILVPPIGLAARESTDYFAVEDPVVAEALRYISSNLSKPLRVDDVAYKCNVSTSGLQLKFQKALGRGVGEEVRRLRIALAKRLLQGKTMTVNEAASRSGFIDGNKMARIFRREVGQTPTEFREG